MARDLIVLTLVLNSFQIELMHKTLFNLAASITKAHLSLREASATLLPPILYSIYTSVASMFILAK